MMTNMIIIIYEHFINIIDVIIVQKIEDLRRKFHSKLGAIRK